MIGQVPPDGTVIVVGTSIAGFAAAAELRTGGFEGRIRMIGEEPVRTYQRPPLSKELLAGAEEASIAWTPAADDALDLEWLLAERAVALDPSARTVRLAGGDALHYDGLVVATGARARTLPGSDGVGGVHVLRTVDDALGLRAELDHGAERVAVVGAGFIGAEVAATARRRGHQVTLIDPLPQPLAGVLGERLGARVADLHRAEGVDLRLGVGVDHLDHDGRVRAVVLDDGSRVEADVVVVGIGVIPNVGWLDGSGLPIDGGIVADATCAVAPGIVAAGDVARWTSPRYGPLRIEHWDHAADMGRAAGRRLLTAEDEAQPFDPVPWFWSDQFDARIQMAGRADGEVQIVDGAIEDDRFVACFVRDDEVTGALAWNWPARAVRYRMRLESPLAWSEVSPGGAPA